MILMSVRDTNSCETSSSEGRPGSPDSKHVKEALLSFESLVTQIESRDEFTTKLMAHLSVCVFDLFYNGYRKHVQLTDKHRENAKFNQALVRKFYRINQ